MRGDWPTDEEVQDTMQMQADDYAGRIFSHLLRYRPEFQEMVLQSLTEQIRAVRPNAIALAGSEGE